MSINKTGEASKKGRLNDPIRIDQEGQKKLLWDRLCDAVIYGCNAEDCRRAVEYTEALEPKLGSKGRAMQRYMRAWYGEAKMFQAILEIPEIFSMQAIRNSFSEGGNTYGKIPATYYNALLELFLIFKEYIKPDADIKDLLLVVLDCAKEVADGYRIFDENILAVICYLEENDLLEQYLTHYADKKALNGLKEEILSAEIEE